MSPQFRTQGDVIGRDHARAGGASLGPWLHTAEARRLRSEAIAEATRWIRANTRRIIADAINDGVPRLTRLVGRFLLEPYARRRRRRVAVARLRALDDRLLADVGLLRSGIELAVDVYRSTVLRHRVDVYAAAAKAPSCAHPG